MSVGRPEVLTRMIVAQAVLNLGFGYLGAVNFGPAGLVAGTALSFAATGVWIAPLYIRRIQKEQEGAALAIDTDAERQ